MTPPSPTRRLTFAALEPSMAADILAANTGSVKHYFFDFPDLASAQAWVDEAVQEVQAGEKVEFALLRKEDDALVGLVSLRDLHKEEAEFGLWIAEEHQRQGFAKEALTALVAWAWGATGAKRLIYECDTDNTPSIALAISLGMLRSGAHTDGGLMRFTLARPHRPLPPMGA